METEQGKWRLLLRISMYSAMVMLVLIPVQIIVFSIARPPETVLGWFELFGQYPFLGLLQADLLYILNNVLVAVMYLALYCTMKEVNPSVMLIALMLGLLGIAGYFSSNTAFEMLELSRLYGAAQTEAERQMFLGVGQAMVLTWQGTAFDIYYVLNGVALIMMAAVMRRSRMYSRRTATVGLIAGFLMAIPSTAGTIGLIFSLLSLIPWMVFTAMLIRQWRMTLG